ncbi:LOW QUALITY PROTEIN: uncharacterized protein [Amphiura filiformis]|uniref:LOW QUALITY PROTEIN: uncharacterized protein n=1 Tax=Amphiura filiformis TaxID=82378 RepID=UPI003B20DB02
MAASSPQLKPVTITVNGPPTSPSPQRANTQTKRDVTILNPPAHAARQGVSQIFDVLISGTPFVRQLLLQETDVIFECRACRSLFRGLLNFVDHKKNFCTMRVGVENAIAASAQSAPSGLQRWMCQDKEPIPVIEPEAPEEEASQTNMKSNKKVPINVKPKQQMIIRKPDATYILVRPISATTKAMEQMVIRPDQILYQSQLDMLSNFRKNESDGTAKLVGEIAIRQAEKTAKKCQTSPGSEKTDGVEKRNTLHTLLKNAKVSSSVVNTVSNSPSKVILSSKAKPVGNGSTPTSSKQVLRVTLGQQKKLANGKQQHQQGHTKKAICKVCKKECKNFSALAWHERAHKKPHFKCDLCFSSQKTMYNLKRHLLNVHHLTPSKVDSMVKYRDQQLQVQIRDAGLKQQLKKLDSSSDEDDDEEEEDGSSDEEGGSGNTTPVKTPTCSVCKKTFASTRNVNRHMQIHRREGHIVGSSKLSSEQIAKNRVLQIMDEKNIKCRKCHKHLSGIRRLQQHCCNHFKLNRYRCSLCQYENVDYTQMRRHVMSKHGRHPQFRTIPLISKAIKKMKVGLWINLIVNNEVDDTNSTHTLHTKQDIKKNSDDGGKKTETSKKNDDNSDKNKNGETKSDKNKNAEVKLDKTKNGDASKVQPTKVTVPIVMVERAKVACEHRDSSSDRGLDSTTNSRASPVLSTPTKLRAPVKKDAESLSASSKTSEVVLRNPSSRSASPASARKMVAPESPKRETPIRQARLNHRSISSGVVQRLNLDKDENSSTSNETMLLMDKRQNRCIECNKQFQYVSSLRRHVQIHIMAKKAAEKKPPAPTKTSAKSGTGKLQNIDSLINLSQLKCTKCHKRFSTPTSLKRHVARHLGYSTYKCRYCDYLSRNYTWFKKHLLLSHPNNVKNVDTFGKLMASMRVKKK